MNSFSQIDTEKDSTKTIQLSNPIAKLVVKDLIQGDASSKELDAMVKLISVTNDKANRQTKLYKIGSAIGGGAIILLLIK